MNLEGEKVKLRLALPSDADTILQWENDPDHWLVSGTAEPYDKADILNFLEYENDIREARQCRFMIMTRQDMPAGCIDLFDFDAKHQRVGIGILIDPALRGKGYGKEALDLVVEYCLDELEVNCVYAEVLGTNTASVRLFENSAFLKSGVRREWVWDGHSFVDQYFYQRFE